MCTCKTGYSGDGFNCTGKIIGLNIVQIIILLWNDAFITHKATISVVTGSILITGSRCTFINICKIVRKVKLTFINAILPLQIANGTVLLLLLKLIRYAF
jgi:hypothetical protein